MNIDAIKFTKEELIAIAKDSVLNEIQNNTIVVEKAQKLMEESGSFITLGTYKNVVANLATEEIFKAFAQMNEPKPQETQEDIDLDKVLSIEVYVESNNRIDFVLNDKAKELGIKTIEDVKELYYNDNLYFSIEDNGTLQLGSGEVIGRNVYVDWAIEEFRVY